jgi:hypothetical protein
MASQAILSHHLCRSPPSSRTNPNPISPLLRPQRLLAPWFVIPRRRLNLRHLTVSSAASSQAAPVNRENLDALERCLSISHDSCVPSCSAEPSLSGPRPTGRKDRGGALSMLPVKKVDNVQLKYTRKPPEVFQFSQYYLLPLFKLLF